VKSSLSSFGRTLSASNLVTQSQGDRIAVAADSHIDRRRSSRGMV
jgi:hypothetical protein